jgi:hypothetical protein
MKPRRPAARHTEQRRAKMKLERQVIVPEHAADLEAIVAPPYNGVQISLSSDDPTTLTILSLECNDNDGDGWQQLVLTPRDPRRMLTRMWAACLAVLLEAEEDDDPYRVARYGSDEHRTT